MDEVLLSDQAFTRSILGTSDPGKVRRELDSFCATRRGTPGHAYLRATDDWCVTHSTFRFGVPSKWHLSPGMEIWVLHCERTPATSTLISGNRWSRRTPSCGCPLKSYHRPRSRMHGIPCLSLSGRATRVP